MPFALVALVVVPAIAGTLRLVELAGGPQLLPANPRITASPVPVVVHIVSAVTYAILGAFQFSAALRRRRPRWHRVAGRVLVVLGLAVAFSALWMTLFYPRHPGTGALAYVFRLAFGSGMAASIILGFTAIRRGDVARHRAWMTRAYALALGAGTQVFTKGIGKAVFGTSELSTDLSLGAGWVINLAVAEYVIRRPGRRRTTEPPSGDRKGRVLMTRSPKRQVPAGYVLRVAGHLDQHWSSWFGDLTLLREDDGTTSITGLIADQAALHGLLSRIRDLGIVLISVKAVDVMKAAPPTRGTP